MIAILSDIHSNLSALQAALSDAVERGCTRFISLGDVAGYHAQTGECIDLLMAHNAINIMGNHDSYLVHGSFCPRSSIVSSIIKYQMSIITTEQKTWLSQSLPSYREGGNYFLHGGPDDLQDQYLYTISEQIIPNGVVNLFAGHTHVQSLVRFSQKRFCNPGSVGQPRDGDCRAAYAILKEEEITLYRVPYDIDRTADAMKLAGFSAMHYENLYVGAQIGGRVDQIKIEIGE
ncbi:metallophosphoesterase family protein [Tumidithrix elongata RA019]|uniref:Metallophosphoesterase family protein n=1 Tax=Tumidithrix elongata BACA0141 TaxID=2716417 RepID=A0AAW9Q765_9CYAN|nr:metallophosphoesterase family protein [Tumidithrix elongata RA019]